jgi:hypothetical protein
MPSEAVHRIAIFKSRCANLAYPTMTFPSDETSLRTATQKTKAQALRLLKETKKRHQKSNGERSYENLSAIRHIDLRL